MVDDIVVANEPERSTLRLLGIEPITAKCTDQRAVNWTIFKTAARKRLGRIGFSTRSMSANSAGIIAAS